VKSTDSYPRIRVDTSAVGQAGGVRALGPAIAYRARSGDDTDRKIVTIVREIGTITGRVVRTMFDVQLATASRILSDLVDRGILVKASTASRGPSVTYGPGAKPDSMCASLMLTR